jgi:hypothetical protein
MAAIKRLIHLRPASTSCAHVSILLSDARNVASSVRQFQSFQRRLSSRVRSVIKSALSPCSGLGSHQEAFLSIKFISLRPRNGSRRVMVNLTAPESVLAVQILCWRIGKMFSLAAKPHPARQRKPATGEFAKGKFSVGRTCTCISNASAIVCLSLHSGSSVPHMCDSRLLPVGSL